MIAAEAHGSFHVFTAGRAGQTLVRIDARSLLLAIIRMMFPGRTTRRWQVGLVAARTNAL
jgi:hypothetical protein